MTDYPHFARIFISTAPRNSPISQTHNKCVAIANRLMRQHNITNPFHLQHGSRSTFQKAMKRLNHSIWQCSSGETSDYGFLSVRSRAANLRPRKPERATYAA